MLYVSNEWQKKGLCEIRYFRTRNSLEGILQDQYGNLNNTQQKADKGEK